MVIDLSDRMRGVRDVGRSHLRLLLEGVQILVGAGGGVVMGQAGLVVGARQGRRLGQGLVDFGLLGVPVL